MLLLLIGSHRTVGGKPKKRKLRPILKPHNEDDEELLLMFKRRKPA